jgi:hypothetical protein
MGMYLRDKYYRVVRKMSKVEPILAHFLCCRYRGGSMHSAREMVYPDRIPNMFGEKNEKAGIYFV